MIGSRLVIVNCFALVAGANMQSKKIRKIDSQLARERAKWLKRQKRNKSTVK